MPQPRKPDPLVPVLDLPLPNGPRSLTPEQWQQLEQHLDTWKQQVLKAARQHPANGYLLGWQQAQAFRHLLQGLHTAAPATAAGAFGGTGPTMTEAARWAETYTLHELNDSLNAYLGTIKDELLYGIRGGDNPTQVAARLYKATQGAQHDWRRIARTEMVRANAIGRMEAARQMGYTKVWVPPHVGACEDCRRLLEGRVFDIDELLGATNYGRPRSAWVACLPLHPSCRHSCLAYEPSVVDAAHAMYDRMDQAGLTDPAALDDLFTSAGQLRPEHANHDFTAAKIAMDVYAEGLCAALVAKNRPRGQGILEHVPAVDIRTDLHQRPIIPGNVLAILASLRRGEQFAPIDVTRDPQTGQLWCWDGQHRLAARRLNGEVMVAAYVTSGSPYDDDTRPLREAMAKVWSPLGQPEVAKTDDEPPTLEQAVDDLQPDPDPSEDLDDNLFDDDQPRPDVTLACEQWWQQIAGAGWNGWSSIYIPASGGALQVRVDYPALRHARPEWQDLSDPDLHLALVATARLHAPDIAPGLTDVRVWPVDRRHGPAAHAHGPVWSLTDARWHGRHAGKTARELHGRLVDSDEYTAWATGAPVESVA